MAFIFQAQARIDPLWPELPNPDIYGKSFFEDLLEDSFRGLFPEKVFYHILDQGRKTNNSVLNKLKETQHLFSKYFIIIFYLLIFYFIHP